jgi:gluconate 2-dehydrogenase gamma chain
MRRREFINLPAKCLGGWLIYTLAGLPVRVDAKDEILRVPLQFFTAETARIIAAACECIFPGDDSGPGASEAGAVIYIDRQLGGPYGRDQYRYTKGPFFESVPEHGYQGQDNPREIYRAGLRLLGADFAEAEVSERTARLLKVETTPFFRMLRTHTIEAMFSDPLHGGNANLIGWQLIGYPGPIMSYRDEIDKYDGVRLIRKPVSLEHVVGHPVRGWEQERD